MYGCEHAYFEFKGCRYEIMHKPYTAAVCPQRQMCFQRLAFGTAVNVKTEFYLVNCSRIWRLICKLKFGITNCVY